MLIETLNYMHPFYFKRLILKIRRMKNCKGLIYNSQIILNNNIS